MSKKMLLRDTGIYIVSVAVLALIVFGIFSSGQFLWSWGGQSVLRFLLAAGAAPCLLGIGLSVLGGGVVLTIWYVLSWCYFFHVRHTASPKSGL